MNMSQNQLRRIIKWNRDYCVDWDSTPREYAATGIVECGKSKRLGLLELGRYKAYLGVQHVDPAKPGWGIYSEAQTRFFASMFVGRQCVALRTFPTMSEALDGIAGFLAATGDQTAESR